MERGSIVLQGRFLSDRRFQLDSLDGLRGLAVLIVFLSHTSNGKTFLLPFADLSGTGKMGVYLFFVLSAFLLTNQFTRSGEEALSKKFLGHYFLRRFVRIYPLYFLYLLLAVVTTLVLGRVSDSGTPRGIPFLLSLPEFIAHLLLQQGKGVTWSIPVEFRYYFILPILGLTYSILFKNKLVPSVVLTLLVVVISQLVWPPSELRPVDPRLGPYLPMFFMGSLLAVIHHNWQIHPARESKKVLAFLDALGVGALMALILMIPSVSSLLAGAEISRDHWHGQVVLLGALWSIVVFSCVAGSGLLRRPFEIRFLRYLGFISFSVYLLHPVVIKQVNDLVPDLPMKGWLELAATIAVSHLSWVFIEKPTSRIGLTKKSSADSTSGPA
jgi:peptidoglycan/LPS O-acetylase OafA/YrhL